MVPQTKVFVGSLPLGSKPEDLRRLFERYGVVTECDVMNRCGFVHMQTEDMASAAIRALNNTPFNGGVITVERGRIKERGRGGGSGGSGGGGGGGGPRTQGGPPPRNGIGPRRGGGGGPGPMRGPPGGGARDAPYGRPPMGDMRGPGPGGPQGPGGPMGARNGGYDRPVDRRPGGYPDDRLGGGGGFGSEDRRGFGGPMDGRPMGNYGGGQGYSDDRRGGGQGQGYPMDDRRGGMFPDDRRGGMFPDDRQNAMMDRRGGGMRPPPMPMPSFDRGAPRGNPMGNGDIFSRRSPPQMRSGGGYGERDPYNQQFPPLGRVGGSGPRGGREMGTGGPRRY